MSNLPLKALPWKDLSQGEVRCIRADSPIYDYAIVNEGKAFKVGYYNLQSPIKYATGFATIEDAKEWAWNHYNEKMQPYVMPSQTWFNYVTEQPSQGDSIVIAWVWMGDKHTIWLESYRPAEIDYLDDCLEVYWSFSPFVKQGE